MHGCLAGRPRGFSAAAECRRRVRAVTHSTFSFTSTILVNSNKLGLKRGFLSQGDVRTRHRINRALALSLRLLLRPLQGAAAPDVATGPGQRLLQRGLDTGPREAPASLPRQARAPAPASVTPARTPSPSVPLGKAAQVTTAEGCRGGRPEGLRDVRCQRRSVSDRPPGDQSHAGWCPRRPSATPRDSPHGHQDVWGRPGAGCSCSGGGHWRQGGGRLLGVLQGRGR